MRDQNNAQLWRCQLIPGMNRFTVHPESEGASVDKNFEVNGPVGGLNFYYATERSALSGECCDPAVHQKFALFNEAIKF